MQALHQVLCIFIIAVIVAFVELLTGGVSVSLQILPTSETLFLMLGFLVQSQYAGFSLVLLCLFKSCSLSSLGELLFSEENMKRECI